MRKFFIQVVDDETGECLIAQEVEAEDIDSAIELARYMGRSRRNGGPVRVTHCTEQPDLSESWFVRQLTIERSAA